MKKQDGQKPEVLGLDEPEVSAAIIVPPVTEPRLDTDLIPPHPKTSKAARRRAMAILMLSIICLGLGQTILFAILPPIARAMGMADMEVGIIFTLSAIMWVVMSPYWGRKSDVWGRKPVILLGVGAFAISLALLGLVMQAGMQNTLSLGVAFLLMCVFRSFHGLFASGGPAAAQAYVADRTAPEERTASLAGLTAAFGLGASIGPGIGAATAQFGAVVPIYVVAVIAVLSFFAILFWLPERSKPSAPKDRAKLSVWDKRLRMVLLYGIGGGILMVLPIQLTGFLLIDVLALDEATASQYLGIALMISSLASLFSQLVIVQRLSISPQLLLVISPAVTAVGHFLVVIGTNFGALVFALLVTGLGTGMILPSYNAVISLSVTPKEQGAAAGVGNSFFAVGFIVTPIIAFTLYKVSPQMPFICSGIFSIALAYFAWVSLQKKVAV